MMTLVFNGRGLLGKSAKGLSYNNAHLPLLNIHQCVWIATIGRMNANATKRIVTYSPAYTLVPTYECFNRCTYCNFRRNPGEDEWMSLAEAREILTGLQGKEVIEILILSGEVHPKSARRQDWFERIYQLCELALEMGFLPHTNVGPLSYEEMAQLKQVNVSMGLMVEQVTPELLKTVHAHAPSKLPECVWSSWNLLGG